MFGRPNITRRRGARPPGGAPGAGLPGAETGDRSVGCGGSPSAWRFSRCAGNRRKPGAHCERSETANGAERRAGAKHERSVQRSERGSHLARTRSRPTRCAAAGVHCARAQSLRPVQGKRRSGARGLEALFSREPGNSAGGAAESWARADSLNCGLRVKAPRMS
jgi:hypothetical protein